MPLAFSHSRHKYISLKPVIIIVVCDNVYSLNCHQGLSPAWQIQSARLCFQGVLSFHHFALCPLLALTRAGEQSPMQYVSRVQYAVAVSDVGASLSVSHIRRWAPQLQKGVVGRLWPVLLQDGGGGMRSSKQASTAMNPFGIVRPTHPASGFEGRL